MDNEKLLINRFTELAMRSYVKGIYTFSDFLNLSEQDILQRVRFQVGCSPFILDGGYEFAERRLAVFGNDEICGREYAPPFSVVEIRPKSEKFSDALTHRDFLGALMSLGVKRETLGDIAVTENEGYVICLNQMAGFILGELSRIKHTSVECEVHASLPQLAFFTPEEKNVNVPSARADAVVSAVFKLSRSEGLELFKKEKVFLNGKLTTDHGREPSEGEIISVRGYGRFKYNGIERTTKKDRLFVSVSVY